MLKVEADSPWWELDRCCGRGIRQCSQPLTSHWKQECLRCSKWIPHRFHSMQWMLSMVRVNPTLLIARICTAAFWDLTFFRRRENCWHVTLYIIYYNIQPRNSPLVTLQWVLLIEIEEEALLGLLRKFNKGDILWHFRDCTVKCLKRCTENSTSVDIFPALFKCHIKIYGIERIASIAGCCNYIIWISHWLSGAMNAGLNLNQ